MSSTFKLVALAISFLGLTSASPLLARQAGCHPNFEGVGVSVVNNALEWGLPSAPGHDSFVISQPAVPSLIQWQFAFSGAPTNSYQIKYVASCTSIHAFSNLVSLSDPFWSQNRQSWSSQLETPARSGSSQKYCRLLLRKFLILCQLAIIFLNTMFSEQAWTVQCNTCNTGASSFKGLYASGCTIASVQTGECVQIDATAGDHLSLAGCDAQSHQTFDFYTYA